MLKLAALDADDLAVLSAQMQDAVLHVGDMSFSKRKRCFALVANRFAWEEPKSVPQRRRTGVSFHRVTAARVHGIKQSAPDEVLSLLAITFEAGEAPSGGIILSFAGGGSIRLDVECIEARLSDMGPAWSAQHRPFHAGLEDGE